MNPRAEMKLNIAFLIVCVLGSVGNSFCTHLASSIGDPMARLFIVGIVLSVVSLLLAVWNIITLHYVLKYLGEYY